MNSLINLSIAEALRLLKNKKLSVTDLLKAHTDRAEETKNLNAYVLMTEKQALDQAKKSEIKYKNGEAGLIEGIPIAVKDLFCTKGIRTTSCSKMLYNFIPEYESGVTEIVTKNGGIMIGKSNMDEFAMGSSNKTSYFGPVINPWKRKDDDVDLVPGGSSGGSATAVAARSCMAALGSDTGGSVRQPASFTGTVGVKPTYGRCSRYGMIAFASSMDQAGVFTRNVEDSAIMLQAMCGYDQRDPTSQNIATPNWSDNLKKGVKGLRIGIPKEYMLDGIKQEISNLWNLGIKWLQEAGAEIVDISLPHTKYALSVYYIMVPKSNEGFSLVLIFCHLLNMIIFMSRLRKLEDCY